jgi:hypothetical protein
MRNLRRKVKKGLYTRPTNSCTSIIVLSITSELAVETAEFSMTPGFLGAWDALEFIAAWLCGFFRVAPSHKLDSELLPSDFGLLLGLLMKVAERDDP